MTNRRHGPRGTNFAVPWNRAILGALIVIGIAAAIALNVQIFRHAQGLREAPRDNVQWALAQLEVEVLQFAAALAQSQRHSDLDNVRRRFDLFYSRVALLNASQVFRPLREAPAAKRELDALRIFLDQSTPMIDGPDFALEEALPAFEAGAREAHGAARRLSLAAVRIFAEASDRRRSEFESLLWVTGAAGVGLMLLLLVSLGFLSRQRRLAEARALDAARSRERLAATIQASLEAIIVVNQDGRIIEYNQAAEHMFGYEPAEAIGSPMADLIVPARFRTEHAEGMTRYLREGQARVVGKGRIEMSALRSNGEEFPVELSIGEAHSPTGPIFIGHIRDISDRVAVEQSLTDARDKALAADRAKSDFIAVISHEMRTPLTGLLGTLDMLALSKLDVDQSRQVKTATDSAETLLRHVNEVLDIARMESGRFELEIAPLDLGALVVDVADAMRPLAEARGGSINVRVEGPVEVAGDAHRLRQIALNCLGNAIKFAGYGVIEIGVRTTAKATTKRNVEFWVSDKGPGIARADQERIFQDFVTLDAGYDRAEAGSGLGLAICRRIVEAMAGEIGVDSLIGAGSRFWWRLQLEATHVAPTPSIPAAAAELSPIADATPAGERLLLVEDNDANRKVLQAMLTSAGYDVATARNGADAVQMAADQAYDLILMDISMPGMDGLEATASIRRSDGASRNTPIIAITAHALPTERDRFLAVGMQGTLIKPIRREKLLAMVANAGGDHPDLPRHNAPPPVSSDGVGRPALFDDDVFADLSASLEPDGLEALTRRFCDQLLSLSEEFERAGSPNDCLTLAHDVAGAAGMFGATALHELLQQFQTALKQGDLNAAAATVEPTRSLALETRAVLLETIEAAPAGEHR